MPPLIHLKNITVIRNREKILRDLSWSMNHNEHWVVLGPNGAGKTTLANVIAGYAWPTSGSVQVLGELYGKVELARHRRRIGIFQPAMMATLPIHHPSDTALEVILTGLNGSLAHYTDFDSREYDRATALFDRHFQQSCPPDRPFRFLSAGERRKILLLRSMIGRPDFLLLDEPFESLDIPSRLSLERVLASEVRQGSMPTITILHRIEEVPTFTTHAMAIKDGRVFCADEAGQVIDSKVLSELYDAPLKVGRDEGRYYCVPVS